ncbi:MAG: ribosomal protein S18-alanine N-acetyltransferase [Gemmatimonadota bacterium]
MATQLSDGDRGAEVRIRRMTEGDLPDVMRIERASFSSPWTLATFAGLLWRDNTRLWVAEAGAPGGSEVVGYAVVWMVAGQAELGDIAVAESWRGRGIGTRLIEAVLAEVGARGVRELFLEVRLSNYGAQRLYERHGFRVVGRRRGYYTNPTEDALVLRRKVEPPAAG